MDKEKPINILLVKELYKGRQEYKTYRGIYIIIFEKLGGKKSLFNSLHLV
jgi:hypothetical protein